MLDQYVSVSGVLDHFHGKYHVKPLAGPSQSLRRCAPVVDLDPCLVSVLYRCFDGSLRRIDADDLRAELREWLAEHASATADIEKTEAMKAITMRRVASEPAA